MTATTFFLVRHAVHELTDQVLVGRSPGVHLSAVGRRQAEKTAAHLARERVTSLYASPLERAQETAQAIAQVTGLPVQTAAELDEIDIGAWTGRRFEDIAGDPEWHDWNRARARTRPPAGESMLEVQTRIVSLLHRLRASEPQGRIAAVSHADVIRSALLHCLGIHLDRYESIEISPAAVSTLVVGDWGAKVIAINERIGGTAPTLG